MRYHEQNNRVIFSVIWPLTLSSCRSPGWLAAYLGRRNYFLLSIAIFTISSGLCGVATSLGQLIFFRVMQGLAGGGLQPSRISRPFVPVGGPPPSELKVHFQSPNLTTSKFQLVIWAAGFGEEICSIRDERHGTGTVQHTGPVFWSSDSLEKKSRGSSVSNPKVVILGGGDGGVQDLLRALTKRRSARSAALRCHSTETWKAMRECCCGRLFTLLTTSA
jgi:hypothetical protein